MVRVPTAATAAVMMNGADTVGIRAIAIGTNIAIVGTTTVTE